MKENAINWSYLSNDIFEEILKELELWDISGREAA